MRVIGNRDWRTVLAVVAALTFGTCGGDKKAGPPTQPTIEPTIAPTPVTPTPAPPLSASCARLAPGATSKYTCRTDAPNFEAEVNDALDTLRAQQPRIFDGDRVRDVGAYVVGMIRILDGKNLCADWDGEELGVARTNNLNDQYDILTAKDQVRRYFVGTCWPSVIPVRRRTAPPPPAGCALPSSVEVSCGDPESRFLDEMLAAIEQVQKDKPQLFDFADRSQQGWPRVKDLPEYYRSIIDIFAAQGLCGRFDGEEIAIKRTNDFTEHFDVNYQDKYVRKGSGIYRGACYPAAF